MRKLLLCVALMLVTLTTFAQGKERVMEFSQAAVDYGDTKKELEWSDSNAKVVIYKNGENKASFEYEGTVDEFKIVSVTKERDPRGDKCWNFLLESPNGYQTTMYMYNRKHVNFRMTLMEISFYMHLKR